MLQRLRMVTELNCQALVQMTRLLLPKMLEKCVERGTVLGSHSEGNFARSLVNGRTKACVLGTGALGKYTVFGSSSREHISL